MDGNKDTRNIVVPNSYLLESLKSEDLNEDLRINGRVYFNYVALTVHNDTTEYQENQICWLEENIKRNLNSAQHMPMIAQFLDMDKGAPFGHGYPTTKDGKPVIIDSEQVGSVVKAEIRDVDVDGQKIKALVATAYVNEIRYPALCQWLKAKMFDKEAIATSVEIFAKQGNNTIVSDIVEVNGKEICVPIDFDFGGSAILTITPADENAIVLEILNSRSERENKKEENLMDIEKLTADLAIANAKAVEFEGKVNSLEATVAEKDEAITGLETEKAVLEESVTNLEADKTALEGTVAELTEYKEGIEKSELIEDLEGQIGEYDEALIEEVKDEIADFKAEPTEEKCEAIINQLNSLYVKKAKEEAAASKKEDSSEMKLNSLWVATENAKEDKEDKEFKVFE